MQQSNCSWIEVLRQVESKKIVDESFCNKIERLNLALDLKVGVLNLSGRNKRSTSAPLSAACAYARRAMAPPAFGIVSSRFVVESRI